MSIPRKLGPSAKPREVEHKRRQRVEDRRDGFLPGKSRCRSSGRYPYAISTCTRGGEFLFLARKLVNDSKVEVMRARP
jgi:hypothetical protein